MKARRREAASEAQQGGIHSSVITVKLSNASGVAPWKPTVSSANAIVRLSPFFASSSGVCPVDAFGDFPIASTASIVRDDVLVFGRFAGCAPSASAGLLRVSVAMAGEVLSTGNGDKARPDTVCRLWMIFVSIANLYWQEFVCVVNDG